MIQIWDEPLTAADDLMWRKFNVRRIISIMMARRHVPPGLKLSRRSRRRWRGKGGEWSYPPDLVKLLEEQLNILEAQSRG
ncbi:hypothetical protein PUR29_34560 [Methylobacterium ajmalii]|uniref:HTH Mu-type domain-containing protein n=1 Tax=Methylobacterium ajmalii TaxID=2738439 RepID=A0ABV0A401_9HYPH